METYTFSRALHMMRYSGAKMRPIHYPPQIHFKLSLNHEVLEVIDMADYEIGIAVLGSHEILSNWVEVK